MKGTVRHACLCRGPAELLVSLLMQPLCFAPTPAVRTRSSVSCESALLIDLATVPEMSFAGLLRTSVSMLESPRGDYCTADSLASSSTNLAFGSRAECSTHSVHTAVTDLVTLCAVGLLPCHVEVALAAYATQTPMLRCM